MPVFAFTAGSFGDILATVGLAAEVAQALYDSKNVSKECESLIQDLKSIQGALVFTEYALRRYSATPLGDVLAHWVRAEVAQCHLALCRFAEQLKTCRTALSVTSISGLWRRVVWVASDEAESLSGKLSNLRSRLSLLLISLNSVGFMDADQLGSLSPPVYFSRGSNSLRRIKDNTIEVLDPLGDTIPISTLFCGSWESFHYIINGYFKNRMGQRYIERGDYEIVRHDTEEVLDHSTFVRDVKEGEVVEMSVVLRPEQSQGEARCPRCSNVNADPEPSKGSRWIRCAFCSGRYKFQPAANRAVDIANQQDSSGSDTEDDAPPSTQPSTSRSPDEVTSTTSSTVREAAFFRRITLEVLPILPSLSSIPASSFLPHSELTPSAWQLFFTEWIEKRQMSGKPELFVARAAKEAGRAYAALSAAEKAPYYRRAQASKEAREKAREEYMRSLAPEDLKRYLSPAQHGTEKARKKVSHRKDPNAPKKPLSAYFQYLLRVRTDPRLSSEIFGDETEVTKTSVMAAARWRSMTEAERQPYVAQAEKDKAEYEAAKRLYDQTNGSNASIPFSR